MSVVEASLTLSFQHQYVRGSKSETMVRRFVCYLMFVFRLDVLHSTKCTLTQVCMCFQTSSALLRNLSLLT